MVCIKELCGYYQKHDFNESWRVCEVNNRNMKHNYDNVCYIEDAIKFAKGQLVYLEESLEHIEEINKSKE